MITDTHIPHYDYDDRNDTADQQNYSNQYQEPSDDNTFEEIQLSENNYLDNEFSNALDRDDSDPELDYQPDDSEDDDLYEDEDEDLDEDDLDDDLVEDYDENDREPETFSDDGYKID